MLLLASGHCGVIFPQVDTTDVEIIWKSQAKCNREGKRQRGRGNPIEGKNKAEIWPRDKLSGYIWTCPERTASPPLKGIIVLILWAAVHQMHPTQPFGGQHSCRVQQSLAEGMVGIANEPCLLASPLLTINSLISPSTRQHVEYRGMASPGDSMPDPSLAPT